MNIREIQRSQPIPVSSRSERQQTDSLARTTEGWRSKEKSKAHTRTLSPVPSSAMNALRSSIPTTPPSSSTIRSVPPDPPLIHTPVFDENKKASPNKSDPMPHSTKSEPNLSYNTTPSHTKNSSLPSQNSANLAIANANSIQRRVSSEFGPTVAYTNSTSNPNVNGISLHVLPADEEAGGPQWNSAVGRASLGKSGRVIERLQAENDKLRRNLNIEKTRAEESKRDASNIEAKMEEQKRDYEAKLHLAVMDKTMLKRRDRQLADLRSQIDGERNRANAAMERELVWKTELDRVQGESKRTVEEALDRAAMMEGRNNAMTSHWKEQGAEAHRAIKKMGKQIEKLNQERKSDDDRMNTLQGLCDQQAAQLKALEEEKAVMQRQFEEYKRFQEESLSDIKRTTLENQRKNEEILEESTRVLGQLKWALAVKNNVKGV